jgi:hypothetical protein
VARLPETRTCSCGQALRGGFHGRRPGWLGNCSLDTQADTPPALNQMLAAHAQPDPAPQPDPKKES